MAGGNPFEFITSLFAQPSDPPGTPPPAPEPQQPPMVNLPMPSPTQAPAYSAPRAAGQQGTLMGFVDHLMGVPTAHQVQLNEAERRTNRAMGETRAVSQAENDIMTRVNAIRSENPDMDPAKLFPQILADPVFTKNAMRVPPERAIGLVQSMLKASTPELEYRDTAPGHAGGYSNKRTGMPVEGSFRGVPTAEVQASEYYMNLSPEQRAQFEQGKDATARRQNAQEVALDEMLAKKEITEEEHRQIRAKTRVLSSVPDGLGGVNRKIIDVVTGKVIRHIANTPEESADSGPGKGTGEVDPMEKPDGRKAKLKHPANMFLGAGAVGWLGEGIGGVAGNISPDLAMSEVKNQRDALRLYNVNLMRLLSADGGRTLKAQYEVLRDLLPDLGPTSNPTHEIGKAKQIRQYLESELQIHQRQRRDPNIAQKDRIGASHEAYRTDAVLRAMPSIAEMEEMEELIRAGKAGHSAKSLLQAVPSRSQVERAVTGDPNDPGTPAKPAAKAAEKEQIQLPADNTLDVMDDSTLNSWVQENGPKMTSGQKTRMRAYINDRKAQGRKKPGEVRVPFRTE